MAKYKCKMCGAPLDVTEGQTVITCDFCQSKQTVANANDERKENLFNRANALRASCDFDKAILSYQSILSIFPSEPEAHWGLCLCKYGIEYVDDPSTHKKVPTIHRVSFDSILKDSDYLAALSYADVVAREEYQEEATQIADIQKNILSISQKEEPFDIFICYKETGANGKRTPDSVWAQEIYSNLTDKGYKVFFSRITLESKLGSMYEPYIFAALNSAKIMLVVGGKKEHFEAVWVKNEWSRFIDMMKTRPDHYLIPCYRDMDAYEMPEQFLSFQGQDMSKLGFMQDLLRGIDKIMGRTEAPRAQAETKIIQTDVNVSALLKRAEILIGDGNFDKADELLERVLDNDPTNSQAYLLKLLIELQFKTVEQLKTLRNTIESNSNYKKAFDFGDQQQKNRLSSINEFITNRNEEERLSGLYNKALDLKNAKRYAEAESAFSGISGYRDSAKQALECVNLGKEDIYNKAISLKEAKQFLEAIETFEKINDFKDSEFQISDCKELFTESQYDKAIQLKDAGRFDDASAIFMEILSFRDSDFQVDECDRLKTEAKKEAVYVTCLFDREINPYFDAQALKKACQNLATIPGYKDSDQLLVRYEGIIKDYEAELARKKEEAAREKAKKMKKVKKVSFFSAIAAVVLTGVLLLTFLLLIPSGRQNDIQGLINAGKYDEAAALIEKNGSFGDSNNLKSMCDAGKAFESLDYETGINYIYNIGGSVDVNYDNNGGTSTKGSETIKRMKYIDNDADKPGYDFHGWVLTGYTMDAKAHYASINLKAQYDIITYSITYVLDGGTSNNLPSSYNTENSTTIPNPTKTGYTFAGWTGLDLTTPTIDYVLPVGSTGNKTYTANWVANEYTIYLNSNGGNVSSTEIKVTYDSKFTLPTPTYTGYEFQGWFDDKAKEYKSGTYTFASDLYLNASWNTHNYTITYNLGGGTNNSNNPGTYTIEDSDITLADPTRTGYTFTGWTTNNVADPTKNLVITSGSTGDLTYTANWEANTYTVTVDLNGGECDTTSYTFTYDSKYSVIAPTRVGYAFDNFTYDNGTVLSTTGTWNVAKDITIKANWIANADTKYVINHYTEDLDGNGYTKVETENPAGYSDSKVTLSAKSYTGFTAVEASKEVTIAADGSTVVDFYYSRNTYTISFVSNGGSAIESETYKYEQEIPSSLKSIRAGYTFAGWYTDVDQTTLFDKMPASDQTVYAYYSEETKASFFNYSFSGQEATVTKGVGLSGTVVVPEYIGGKLVTKVGNNAFLDCSSITEITLSSSVEELGSAAFKGCTSLSRINGTSNLSVIKESTFEGCSSLAYFPDLSNVTSIGNMAFKGCSSLTTITISDSLTSIGDYAFQNCVLLLQTPDLTNVTSIGDYAFSGCNLLTEIKSLDGCATFGEGIFTACENIAKITLSFRENIEQFYVSSFFGGDSSYDSSKYYRTTGKNGSSYYIPKKLNTIEFDSTEKTPDYLLYGLTSITTVADNSDSSTTIGKYAFYNCSSLASYSVSNPGVDLIGEYAFYNCSSLITLPSFELDEVKQYAFANCSALLSTPNIENASYIGDYAFSGCCLITSVKNANASYFGVDSLYGCSALEEVEVPFVGTTINSSEAFGVIFGTTPYNNSYATTQLSKIYYIPSGLTKLTIGGSAISANSCVNLISVTELIVSDSVETIGNYAFNGMISLEKITVPYIADNGYGLGYFFGRYYNYQESLPSGMSETVRVVRDPSYSSWYYIYYVPSTLREVSVTVATNIPSKAFYNCRYLTNIQINPLVKTIGEYAFSGCSNLYKLNSSVDGIANIPTGITNIQDYCFNGCGSFEMFNIGNLIESIGNYAFADCNLMSNFNSKEGSIINIPDSCTSIGEYAFKNAGIITELIVSDSVETIGNYAFNGMISLEKITVPYIADNGYGLGYFFGRYYNYQESLPSGMSETVRVARDPSYSSWYYIYYVPSTLREVSVTVATNIPSKAFYNCRYLTNVHLTDCIGNIGNDAFENCNAAIDYSITPSRSDSWDGSTIATSYHGGTGTLQDPYQIFSAKEFVYFLNQIRDGENYDGVYFVLTSNINLGGYAINATALTQATSFKGVLDGNSHKVFNFTITSSDNSYNGLFGYVDGTIKNIGFETSMVVTTSKTTDVYVGLIVGMLNGSIENVYASGSLTSTSLRTSYVGGLVGYNNGSVLNSYANINVSATSTNLKCYAGGLVGYNNDSITGSFAYGNVSAKGYAESYSYASGLVGLEGNNSTVTNCFRYSGQTITKFGNSSTSYNNVGESDSLEDIITYCKANWNGSVWSYNKALPSF